MTRKDYLLIAEVLRVQRYRAELEITHAEEFDKEFACGCAEGADSAAMELCDSLHRDNPRFDRAHFLAVVRGEKELTSKPERKTPYQPYQPKTGQPCSCRAGIQRDNCPQCEGTGQRIDFAAIRNRNK